MCVRMCVIALMDAAYALYERNKHFMICEERKLQLSDDHHPLRSGSIEMCYKTFIFTLKKKVIYILGFIEMYIIF